MTGDGLCRGTVFDPPPEPSCSEPTGVDVCELESEVSCATLHSLHFTQRCCASFVAAPIDVFAWGKGVDDLYSCARARVALVQRDDTSTSTTWHLDHETDGLSVFICILHPHVADLMLLDLGRILQAACCKRPVRSPYNHTPMPRLTPSLSRPLSQSPIACNGEQASR